MYLSGDQVNTAAVSTVSTEKKDGEAGSGAGSGSKPAVSALSLRRSRLIFSTLCFILGFTSIFIILSFLFSGFFMLLGRLNSFINMAAGIIIIIFGLNILFNFIPFLNYEKRFHLKKNPRNFWGSFVVGLAFGVGWTPCIGPILGSILLLAGQRGELFFSAACLAAYSAGLGLPFLAAALFLGFLLKRLARLRALVPVIQKISGLFLITMGIFMTLGRFKTLNSFFMKTGYLLAVPARNGGRPGRIIPALFFLLTALMPPLSRLIKKRPLLSWGLWVFSGLFMVLAVLQGAGLINCLELLSQWFMFIGI
ncbi:MAG: cytochrome c biogenesis CcdA family protein [Treponema sp.]|nr:cytochrome c biogenesis CcdA family protein [Treponema sp.]